MAGYDGNQHESIKSPRVRESFGLGIGELLFERGSDDVQFRPRLSKRKTWPQSANFCKEKNRAVAQGIPLLGRQNLFRHHGGDPDIGPKTAYTPLKPLGPIPMMVNGVLLSLMVRPRMSSPERKNRPMNGWRSSVSK